MDVTALDSLRIVPDPIERIGVSDLIAGGSIAVFFRFVDRRRTSDYDAETAT